MSGRSQPIKTTKTDTMYSILVDGFHVSIGLGNIFTPPHRGGPFVE
jgi:hypothetical protein